MKFNYEEYRGLEVWPLLLLSEIYSDKLISTGFFSITLDSRKIQHSIKETVTQDFCGPFLAFLERSGPKNKPLLVSKLFVGSRDFRHPFLVHEVFHPKKYWRSLESPIKSTNFDSMARRY